MRAFVKDVRRAKLTCIDAHERRRTSHRAPRAYISSCAGRR
ncbi:protein of unknown function (plasmid) [Caballeronia sp. S22]